MDDPDYEWLMIDASYIKAHPHSAGARAATKPLPGLNSKQIESSQFFVDEVWRWLLEETRWRKWNGGPMA